MIGKLEYCGGGQIRDAKTKQLVSPREIVSVWNDLLEKADDFSKAANEAVAELRSITFAMKVHDTVSLHEVYDLLCGVAAKIPNAMGAK